MAEEEETDRGPFWAFFQENSPLFRELGEAKEMVAKNKNNDKDFSNNRPVNNDCSAENMNRHAQQFRDVLAEIDSICGGFIRNNGGSISSFLDICCAPGGFTKYVLEETQACGMGVTLPVEEGGHPMIEELLSPPYTDRFHVVYQDIIDDPTSVRFVPPDAVGKDEALASERGCDFVIMGGMYQGNKPWLASQGLEAARKLALAEGREPPVEQAPKFTDHHIGFDALLVAQMIIALNNLAPRGTLMLTVNCNGNLINCSTLCLLRALFQRAHSAKVRVMHAHRGTFRVVFQGYDPAAEKTHRVVEQLQGVLKQLRNGTRVECLSVPGVTGVSEMVERFGANVQRLYEPVWAVQLEALRRRFPSTFGLVSGGRYAGRSARGRAPGSNGETSGRGGDEDGPKDGARADRWGRKEPVTGGSARGDAPSLTNQKWGHGANGTGGRPSLTEKRWGHRGQFDHEDEKDRSTRRMDQPLSASQSVGSSVRAGSGKSAYVPPHLRARS